MSADLRRVLIGCRGELVRRLIQTYRGLGIEAVVAFSSAETNASYLEEADYDAYLGEGRAVWVDEGRLVSAAMDAGCDAIHPGYGEIARRPGLYSAASAANLAVIGVDPRRAPDMLHRSTVISSVENLGFHVPQWDVVGVDSDGIEAAAGVGVPLIAVGAGGGAEIRVDRYEQILDAVRALRGGSQAPVLLIHAVEPATAIEVVIAGDRSGRVVPLAVIVGAGILEIPLDDPYPWLANRSVRIAEKMGFVGVGALRYRMSSGEIAWFAGFDPHLPVAYDLVERVCGIDLLALQHRLVTGQPLGEAPSRIAHGVQAQIWSQGSGLVGRFEPPAVDGVGVASALAEGESVGPDSEPLLAKLTAAGPDPVSVRASLWEALHRLRLDGVPTRLDELRLTFGPLGPIASA